MTVFSEGDECLAAEHALLQRAYARAQARCSRLVAEQARAIAQLEAQALRLRAAVVLRDTALAWARQDHAALEASVPGLPRRRALALRVEALMARIQDLLWERRQRQRTPGEGSAVPAPAASRMPVPASPPEAEESDMPPLPDLEHSLVAADLVICQTGCLSHNDYWRVQDHCKRTGKACVLVDEPEALRIVRIHRSEKGHGTLI